MYSVKYQNKHKLTVVTVIQIYSISLNFEDDYRSCQDFVLDSRAIELALIKWNSGQRDVKHFIALATVWHAAL